MSGVRSGCAPARAVRLGQFASLAAANAAAVAALYWNQALVQTIGVDFPDRTYLLSLIPTMTLAGYAVGVALIAFGPAVRRPASRVSHISVVHMGALAVALAAAGAAPNVPTLVLVSFCVGCGAAVAQRLIATAARLGGTDGAGLAIGTVLGAALGAILAVRLAGDTLAHAIGWRAVFFMAAACVAAAGLLGFLTRAIGEPAAAAPVAFGEVRTLWRISPLFRWATLQQMMLFAAYNAAWMTALVEVPARERSLVVIGGGGAGLVAALAGGWIVDRFRHFDIPRAGAACVIVAGGLLLPAAYGATPGLSRVIVLLPGMALLDAGLQVALVANQARAQALMPAARSRLAATLTVFGSSGGGIGAGAGYWLWQRLGWPWAVGFAAAAGGLGLACSLLRAAEVRRMARVEMARLHTRHPIERPPAGTSPPPSPSAAAMPAAASPGEERRRQTLRQAAASRTSIGNRRTGPSHPMLLQAKACTAYRGSSAIIPTTGA